MEVVSPYRTQWKCLAAKTKKMSSPFPGERDEEGEREREVGMGIFRGGGSPPQKARGKGGKDSGKRSRDDLFPPSFFGPPRLFWGTQRGQKQKEEKRKSFMK